MSQCLPDCVWNKSDKAKETIPCLNMKMSSEAWHPSLLAHCIPPKRRATLNMDEQPLLPLGVPLAVKKILLTSCRMKYFRLWSIACPLRRMEIEWMVCRESLGFCQWQSRKKCLTHSAQLNPLSQLSQCFVIKLQRHVSDSSLWTFSSSYLVSSGSFLPISDSFLSAITWLLLFPGWHLINWQNDLLANVIYPTDCGKLNGGYWDLIVCSLCILSNCLPCGSCKWQSNLHTCNEHWIACNMCIKSLLIEPTHVPTLAAKKELPAALSTFLDLIYFEEKRILSGKCCTKWQNVLYCCATFQPLCRYIDIKRF